MVLAALSCWAGTQLCLVKRGHGPSLYQWMLRLILPPETGCCVVACLSSDTGLDQRKSCVYQSPLWIIFKEETGLKSLQATQQPSPTSPEQLQDVLQPPRKQRRGCAEREHLEGAVGRRADMSEPAKLWHPLLEAPLDIYLVGNGDQTLFPPSATQIRDASQPPPSHRRFGSGEGLDRHKALCLFAWQRALLWPGLPDRILPHTRDLIFFHGSAARTAWAG